eukprot:1366599-Amorphochlora_amoeboformis.AAC.1
MGFLSKKAGDCFEGGSHVKRLVLGRVVAAFGEGGRFTARFEAPKDGGSLGCPFCIKVCAQTSHNYVPIRIHDISSFLHCYKKLSKANTY